MITTGLRLQPYTTGQLTDLLKGTCPHDGNGWQLVLGRRVAVPIREEGPGFYRLAADRKQVDASYVPDDGAMLATPWTWMCGTHQVVVELPTVDVVTCQYQAGDTGGCSKWRLNTAPKPADFYSNPRYGQSCDCCGHSGEHSVRRDGLGARPRCLQ